MRSIMSYETGLYLRLSITDACPFRCPYCQPTRSFRSTLTSERLTAFEIERAVRGLVAHGVTRVRLTGGEPLVRPDCVDIVRRLRGIAGLREIALTTNGQHLEAMAEELNTAGLDRVNIHLDTLRADRFNELGGRGDLEAVMRGAHIAREMGLTPVKINTVLMKGLNSDEILALCELARQGFIVRFIEMMDTGPARAFVRDHFMSAGEAVELIAKHERLEPRHSTRGRSPAREYTLGENEGTIGFVASETEPFCTGCNRLRLTASGVLKGCLHQTGGADLRAALRDISDDTLHRQITAAIGSKQSAHTPGAERSGDFSMAVVGG